MSTQSYRAILKNTSIFGGVQFFQIFVTLIKAKFIAVLLGSVGMGISGILMSTINVVISIANLGLNYSGVREISKASEESKNTSKIIRVFLILTILTGVMGSIVTIAISPYLSQTAFGNHNYTTAFIFLSSVVLFNIVTTGLSSIFQGLRHTKYVAKSSIIGSIIGLFTSIPLYIYFELNGIVPAIIIASITSLSINFFFYKKINIKDTRVTKDDILTEGNGMLKLGIIMMLSVFLGAFATFIVNSFISNNGGLNDVGLYQAGMSLTNQYIGLIFSAMAMDYLPRLSAVCNDKHKLDIMVNQQAEVVLLIISPLLLILIITAPLIVKVLLSAEFLPIISFVRIVAVGMMFKAAVYSVGYISFAKGDKWFFFTIDAVTGNITQILLNIVMYKYFGFIGLGVSFLLIYIIGFIKIIFFTKLRYNFNFNRVFYKIFLVLLSFVLVVYILITFFYSIYIFITCFILLVPMLYYVYVELDKRIEIKILLSKLIRFK